MIKHIVMWKLKDEAEGNLKVRNAEIMKEKLESLENKVKELKSIEVGINIEESAQAFDVVLYSEFDSVDELNIYQVNEEHVKVASFVRSVVIDRVVVDYQV